MTKLKTAFLALAASAVIAVPALAQQENYRFVVVPKVVHPWFDLVNEGAQAAAAALEAQTGSDIEIIYSAPTSADVVQQNQIIESAIATSPDGLAVDLLDPAANRAPLEDAEAREIPLVIFDSIPPEGMQITYIGSDFCEQAKIAARRLVEILDGEGKVAIMQGVPTAPNHAIRAECHREVFAEHDGIEVVAEGIDMDDIQQAQSQAAAIMQANPDLDGWVASNAAGPVGIGQAIIEAGKTGEVQLVGMDNLQEMLDLISDGVADSSSASQPQLQGWYSVMMLWAQANDMPVPLFIDTGNAFLTADDL